VSDPREIPAVIPQHNLFGVDSDPRAIQIASLYLMLTAKEPPIGLGLSPVEVQIRKSVSAVLSSV